MRREATTQKFFALAGVSFLLTLTTLLFGTPFLRVLQKAYRPIQYWGFGLAVMAVFILLKVPVIAVLLGSVWFLIGIYGEVENRGGGWKRASFLSLLVSGAILFLGLLYVFKAYDINTWDRYVLVISETFASFQQINPALKVDANMLAQQTPSMLLGLLLTCLGNALIFEDRVFRFFKIPHEKIASQLKLLEFRLPDAVIWIFLLAFLISMVNFGIPALSVVGFNFVNVGVILFFFQGLAVLEVFFGVMKTSYFVRVLTYIILVGYLFVLLSALGLIDYWVDLRARLRRLQTPATNIQ